MPHYDNGPEWREMSLRQKLAIILAAPFVFIWVTIACLLPMAITAFLIWLFFFS